MATYLARAEYDAGVQALLDIPAHEPDRANAVKIILGELLDIWPETIVDDSVGFLEDGKHPAR